MLGLDRAEKIARRVALLAMGDGMDEIVAAIPILALRGIDLERPGREEQAAPEDEKRAPAERRLRLVRLVGLGRGREAHEIGVEIGDIADR